MEISNEKFGMLLKEAASEAGRRRGISVAHILIDEGVIGLDRYRRFRYLPPANPIASLTRFSRFLSNNVPCAKKAKGQLFSASQLHTFRHLSTDHYTIS